MCEWPVCPGRRTAPLHFAAESQHRWYVCVCVYVCYFSVLSPNRRTEERDSGPKKVNNQRRWYGAERQVKGICTSFPGLGIKHLPSQVMKKSNTEEQVVPSRISTECNVFDYRFGLIDQSISKPLTTMDHTQIKHWKDEAGRRRRRSSTTIHSRTHSYSYSLSPPAIQPTRASTDTPHTCSIALPCLSCLEIRIAN